MLSHVLEHGNDLGLALTAVGGLDLDRAYRKKEELWVAVRAAKRADRRILPYSGLNQPLHHATALSSLPH